MKIDDGEKALQWLQHIEAKYQAEIANTISKQKIYRSVGVTPTSEPECNLIATDSVSAVLGYASTTKRVCVLNFASYKTPGGGFIRGMLAQEEALCHASTLYPCLFNEKDYYAYNNAYLLGAAYTNAAIYSPDVVFEVGNYVCKCDVLTCAAPNKFRYTKYSDEEMNSILEDRIKFMYSVAADNNVDTLIVGAWGCGVFHQDPSVVAELLKRYAYISGASIVIAAVPRDFGKNYMWFSYHFI